MDVLSIIPTHLPSQGDRFRASFVCRHWRRTLLQHAALWSHLILSKGEAYVKTLLERAKGSPLTVVASRKVPVDAIPLLHPHIKRITNLELANSRWADIQRFSDIDPGPLPLLHTLVIDAVQEEVDHELITSPSHPLFSGAVDLKEFCLHSMSSPYLSHFVFPNLTSFEFSVTEFWWPWQFNGSELLDFLEASPMLQVVDMTIAASLSLPQERVVVLRNVESFCLVTRDGGPDHKFATYISCPSVKHASLANIRKKQRNYVILLEPFPDPDSCDRILHQYMRSPIEEVMVQIKTNSYETIACSLTFLSPDSTVKLRFEVTGDGDQWKTSFAGNYRNIFCEASRTIRDLPLLASIKRLHMCGIITPFGGRSVNVESSHVALIRSLRSLEELTLCRCSLELCLIPFLGDPEIHELKEPIVYPPLRVLTIFNPLVPLPEYVVTGLVGLARVQFGLGAPFKRVAIHMSHPPAAMEEMLRPWVDVVDFRGPDEAYIMELWSRHVCIGLRVVR